MSQSNAHAVIHTPRPDAAGTARASDLRGPFGKRAIRVGRLFGIEIGLDWSWVFIFLLITFSLAQGFAQGEHGWSTQQSWLAGILASLLFFASILLHEFGHSLTSQALGLPVRSITLFIFGGLARLSGEPKRPRDEFLIAAAGPLVSVVLGFLFLAAAALFPHDPPSVFGVACGWLGTINLVLAGFNLVPGFPLDGGRLMRAVVWHLTGNYERATYAASTTGSAFAFLMIGGGIFLALLGGALFNGLWLVFIGWFLLTAAQGSALQVTLQRELGGIPLAAAVEPLRPLVGARTPVGEVLESVVLGEGSRYFFVEDGGEVVGLVTLHQIRRVPVGERASTPVSAIMLERLDLTSIPKKASLWDAFQRMGEAGIAQIPVEEGGRLVGVLTRERLQAIMHNVRSLGGH